MCVSTDNEYFSSLNHSIHFLFLVLFVAEKSIILELVHWHSYFFKATSIYINSHVKWVHCHHGMARPRVAASRYGGLLRIY
jgi:hypothetical protein